MYTANGDKFLIPKHTLERADECVSQCRLCHELPWVIKLDNALARNTLEFMNDYGEGLLRSFLDGQRGH